MKYVIERQFSFKKKKFEITSGSKTICTVKAKEHNDRFDIKLSHLSKTDGEKVCIVQPDPAKPKNYLIYVHNGNPAKKELFGEWSFAPSGLNNNLYTITIGRRLYTVRSCDLKDRRLSIIDTIEQPNISNPSEPPRFTYSHTLCQTIDPFCKSNDTYHVTVHDKEDQFGYLAIVILLDIYESKYASA